MLESVQNFVGQVFGGTQTGDGDTIANDPRKKDYGDLDDIKYMNDDMNSSRRQAATRTRERAKARLGARSKIRGNADLAGHGNSRMLKRERTVRSNDRVRKKPNMKRGRISSIWQSLKTVFSNEDQDLNLMQRACGNVNVMIPQSKSLSGPDERRRMKERFSRSEAFKRKLLEIKYDDKLLDQLRRGRSHLKKGNMGLPQGQTITDDQVVLLQRKLVDLETRLKNMFKDLQITHKKLKFAQEKNILLESLLDDANIDSEYVKSRRDIKNIQKENLKPETELPPSPRRTVNPLFTSSPMRKPSVDHGEELGTTDSYYNKYPKIPETEILVKGQRTHSLSPIRIDYSKYSL